MKNFKIFMGITALALILSFAVSSCKKDTVTTITVDKTKLNAVIDSTDALLTVAKEGTADGNYERGSKDVLKGVLDVAKSVAADKSATQTQVDNSTIALNEALSVFATKIIVPISPDNLVGQWTFDEGSGTVAHDYSGHSFDGTFMDGSATWKGGMPEWTTDRYGDAGKALAFDKGAHVVIPYNTALNPDMMTVCIWVNAADTLASNRFLGLHSWNGYKFQLQDANKAFFTAATTEGIYDRDTDPALDINKWYFLAVTVGDGNMTFYINGIQTMTYADVPGNMAKVSGNDLVIGQGSDVYAATADNYDNDKIIPLAWGGYFQGSLDELRIYNTVLSSTQIASIYNVEKPESK